MIKSPFPKRKPSVASLNIDKKSIDRVTSSHPINATMFIILYLFFTPLCINAQKALTYYDDIEPIIQKNCVACHRQGQIAPFPLMTYEDVDRRAGFIKKVTAQKYMPPNPSDPSVSTFKNVKKLTQEEIDKIGKWVEQGKTKGKEPKLKEKRQEAIHLDTTWREPDLVLTLKKSYTIKGDNREHFVVFVVPTNTTEDLFVSGIDFIPENRQLAHHCRFMIDTTHLLRSDNSIEVGDDSEFQRLGVKMNDNFWHGWIPGNTAIFYPEGTAKRLPKGSDIILNMHFSPSSKELTEQSKILIYLSKKKTAKRLVKTFILEENAIVNEPFIITKDTIIKFYQRSPVIPYDISLVSITPHMHLLGKNFKSFAITPEGDLINLIQINNWDFNWQMTYQFDKLLKIPKGSVIYAEAEYDNTSRNGQNPYDPPRDIMYGWGTKDEMMNLIFQYLEYEQEDEK